MLSDRPIDSGGQEKMSDYLAFADDPTLSDCPINAGGQEKAPDIQRPMGIAARGFFCILYPP
jgi:hypothetical protein